jgi:hypothetical protein
MLKNIATLFVISFSACLTVYAQTDPVPPTAAPQVETKISPDKQALIAELLRVMDSKKQTEEVLNATLDQFEKQMPEIVWAGLPESSLLAQLSDREREELRNKIVQSSIDTSKRFRDLISQRLDFAKLDEITGSIYGKYFNEAELADLIQFYKSSTGQHTMQILPQMLAESMARSQELLMPIIKDIIRDASTEETQKFQKEVTAIVESHHRVKKTGTAKRRPQ